MKNLYLVRGLPSPDKSTVTRSLGKPWQIFEVDQFFIKDKTYNLDPTKLSEAHNLCKRKIPHWMHPSIFGWIFFRNIVVSNTFIQDSEMKFYRIVAKKYGYKIHTIIVESPHVGQNVHGTSEEKIDLTKNRLQIKL